MQVPVISVIIPTYNSEKTLRQTLESLQKQTFSAFEVVIIDGASRDRTSEIVQAFVQQDRRIHFFSEPDKGIYDAMNKGIRRAAGDWIYFLGSDDVLADEHVFESMAQVLQKTNSIFVYGNVLMENYKGWYDGAFTYEKLLRRNISHQAIFYHKQVFALAGHFDVQYKTHADWAFNIHCFQQQEIKNEYVDLLVACFSAQGASAQHDRPFLKGFLLPKRLEFLSQGGVDHLKNIAAYDEWWRLIRNAGISTTQQLLQYAGEQKVPLPLLSMPNWQSRVGAAWLKKGVVSKTLMLVHYTLNRLAGKI